MQLLLARHPSRLSAKHPILIENLLEFSANQQQAAIDSIIEMLTDLHQSGRDSRFLKKMKSNLVWALKTRSRGGQKGGARVYLFFYTPEIQTVAVIVNTEIKDDNEPSEAKLIEVLEVALAFKHNPQIMKKRSA